MVVVGVAGVFGVSVVVLGVAVGDPDVAVLAGVPPVEGGAIASPQPAARPQNNTKRRASNSSRDMLCTSHRKT